ncbi:hypothetical protein HX049_17860 [Myroides odoratimimus]|uniref:hypothetical protein n=1 Tax=Myroides odoratimimus TaxID=76832 RepID=UPI0025756E32|nr:hypothetical protein [Myroides odoratimimus]MDM1399002.1 hypothetical protein [Myroides odoratimimus]
MDDRIWVLGFLFIGLFGTLVGIKYLNDERTKDSNNINVLRDHEINTISIVKGDYIYPLTAISSDSTTVISNSRAFDIKDIKLIVKNK